MIAIDDACFVQLVDSTLTHGGLIEVDHNVHYQLTFDDDHCLLSAWVLTIYALFELLCFDLTLQYLPCNCINLGSECGEWSWEINCSATRHCILDLHILMNLHATIHKEHEKWGLYNIKRWLQMLLQDKDSIISFSHASLLSLLTIHLSPSLQDTWFQRKVQDQPLTLLFHLSIYFGNHVNL